VLATSEAHRGLSIQEVWPQRSVTRTVREAFLNQGKEEGLRNEMHLQHRKMVEERINLVRAFPGTPYEPHSPPITDPLQRTTQYLQRQGVDVHQVNEEESKLEYRLEYKNDIRRVHAHHLRPLVEAQREKVFNLSPQPSPNTSRGSKMATVSNTTPLKMGFTKTRHIMNVKGERLITLVWRRITPQQGFCLAEQIA